MTPTPEQQALIAAAHDSTQSLMVTAMAGCAKTTSLTMIAKALPLKPALCLAFNVRTKKEIERKLPKTFETLTLNGLGHRAWARAIGRQPRVNPSKLFETLKQTHSDLKSQASWSEAHALIRAARTAGLVPEPVCRQFPGLLADDWPEWEAIADSVYLDLSDDLVFLCRRTLQALIKKSFDGEIDYDDQLYMSALFGGVFPKYDCVMVDEAQDLSAINHRQVRKTARDRLIVVGDPRQAIYAFRGADSSSMATLRGLRPEWIDLPLSRTFRCPRAIVARQQAHAPGFEAAATNLEGSFHDLQGQTWNLGTVRSLCSLEPGIPLAILCRNNAPIIACALRIIKSGVGCSIIGNELGKALVALSRKILPSDDLNSETCRARIEKWRDDEISKAEANSKHERAAIITDRAECLLAVLDSGGALTSAQLRATLTTMFDRDNVSVILATGHKAKGLEWPVVIHLDPWRVPSKYARRAQAEGNPVPMQQDLNLRYVIETRTKNILINANLEDMK